MEDCLLVVLVAPLIQVLGKLLPSVVNLHGAVSFLSETSNDEVTHSEEQLFVTTDLFMIATPRCHDGLQPETF